MFQKLEDKFLPLWRFMLHPSNGGLKYKGLLNVKFKATCADVIKEVSYPRIIKASLLQNTIHSYMKF